MTNGTDTGSRDAAHTTWCDPAECATTPPGWHESTPSTVDDAAPDISHPAITVHIVQYHTGLGPKGYDGPPFIDMTIHTPPHDETDTDDEYYTALLTPERAVALGRLLTTAGQAATRQPTT